MEGLSVRAIAEQLGEPEERVRWQLTRSMGLLDRKDPLGRLELELTFSQPNVCCGCCRTRCCKLFCPHCHACHPLRDNKTVRSDLEAHNKKKRLQAEEAARRADLKKKMEDGIAKAGEAKRKMKKEHDDKRAAKRKHV